MERVESEEFRASKKQLKADGHAQCFICGSTEKLNVHHFICQWVKQEQVDYTTLKLMCEKFDPYGYGKLMQEQEMTSVDDIRNLIVLCEGHHKRADYGIHNIPFADFMLQKVREQDEN